MNRSVFVLILVLLTAAVTLQTVRASSRSAPLSVQDPMREKRERTPAQQKIDTQLLYAIYRERGEAEARGVPPGGLALKLDDKGRVLVGIRARVTKALLDKIEKLGGKIVSSSARYNDVRAYLRLAKLEELAALKDVSAIMPAEEAMTNRAK